MKTKMQLLVSYFVLIFIVYCQTDNGEKSIVKKELWGTLEDGRPVHRYTLQNKNGMTAKILDYGMILQSLMVTDRNGELVDVVLGFDNLKSYIDDDSFQGIVVGRFGNRIKQGRFVLDGDSIQLDINDHGNHLHGGGRGGFGKVLWQVEERSFADGVGIRGKYLSPDGEFGYPGNLQVIVDIILTNENALRFEFHATTDKPTIVNMTQHSYFNLSGDPGATILDYELMIAADAYTPVDSTLIPTGEIAPVEGTPFDFRKRKKIGRDINQNFQQLRYGGGYDHNFVLNDFNGEVRKVCELYDARSGRLLELFTDQPGLQFYSGNFLNGSVKGKGGVPFTHRGALCLEPQHFPDSPNHANFPSVVLRPGEEYKHISFYRFSSK